MTTLLLIGITVLVSLVGFSRPVLVMRLLFWPPALSQKRQYERLVTHGFVHSGVPHLAFNMITLYFFGRLIESVFDRALGQGGFALFYLVAIIVAILPSWLRHRDDANYRSLGASGGVSAVLFSFILFRPWATIYIYFLPVPAVIYALVYVGYTIYRDFKGGDRVNHSAHLSGAVFGVVATALVQPQVLGQFLIQISHPAFHR